MWHPHPPHHESSQNLTPSLRAANRILLGLNSCLRRSGCRVQPDALQALLPLPCLLVIGALTKHRSDGLSNASAKHA
ncbi:unnamed protein product [Alternaria burnsii]|nr:unnamed protein product [Alternaria burnsii]